MEPTTDAYLAIAEVHGVFVDAMLTDEADNLVFGSFWGHDTAIRELQGRLTLGASEGGLSALNVLNEGSGIHVRIGSTEELEQMSGRVHTDILGDLVHLWLFRREVLKPDLANHRAILISESPEPKNLWQAVMQISPVPLLDYWDSVLLPIMKQLGMIKPLRGLNQYGHKIVINEEEMALLVKQECHDGRLTL